MADPGKLFLVATPIGNLADITARALETLQRVTFVVCEDTRHSRILLEHYRLRKETVSLPVFAEAQRAGPILDRIAAGQDCALITDAGSPGISDPGEKLVAGALERGIAVHPIPGPSALVAVLSASGLPTSRFHFLGFLPRKAGEQQRVLDQLKSLRATLVVYESPRRVPQTLRAIRQALGNRRACIARELTKVHEEFLRGTLDRLIEDCDRQELRGEVVVIVEGQHAKVRWSDEEMVTALRTSRESTERLKDIARDLSRDSGWSAQEIYRLGLSLKEPS
ncbi:MAG TPA: 16S rRNA (cytidine(1402)-2'-O)-methyltransferase [Myxococcales bacterium]